jgi:glycosyltransferase involved in cell wall biosynthesis
MRIAVVAPPWFPVPPPAYGGTERVCALVARGLRERGHGVVLYATGDSRPQVRLRAGLGRHRPELLGSAEREANHLSFALPEIGRYDVVHDNSSAVGPLLWSLAGVPALHTVHGGLTDDSRAVYRRVGDRVALVSLSRSQQEEAPELRWADAIPNPVDVSSMPYTARKAGYVAFVARMAPEKAPHLAIEACRRAGTELVLAGPVHDVNRDYFEQVVAPRIDGGRVRYLGSLDERAKNALLTGARALLCPAKWSEPFGLVTVEAMACGTPVIAFPRGALRETIEHGRSGFLVGSVAEMAEAIADVGRLDPGCCRDLAAERFSVQRVAARYEQALARAAARPEVARAGSA